MYRITWDIRIGTFRLGMVESVTVKTSVEALTDTATIVLPGTVLNRALEIEDKVKVGDRVTIAFGYDGENREEFKGYVQCIKTDGGSLTIECEDDLWLMRKAVRDKAWNNVDVQTVLNYILSQVGVGIALNCDYTFSYEKFTISNANGLDVLKKIQEEAGPNIYLADGVLHVHPKYTEIMGSAAYDFAKNIDRDGVDLEYKRADDVKVLVTVKGKTADGKEVKVEMGSTGGESVVKDFGTSVSNAASLKAKAEEMLKEKGYEGYRGSFQGWLVPVCGAGYKVTLRDADYEYKDGTYYVLAVETSIGRTGGIRKIELGKKISI